jgi:hypothetical protein
MMGEVLAEVAMHSFGTVEAAREVIHSAAWQRAVVLPRRWTVDDFVPLELVE